VFKDPDQLRTIIRSLVEHISNSRDVSYLRRRNDELAFQVRKAKKRRNEIEKFSKKSR